MKKEFHSENDLTIFLSEEFPMLTYDLYLLNRKYYPYYKMITLLYEGLKVMYPEIKKEIKLTHNPSYLYLNLIIKRYGARFTLKDSEKLKSIIKQISLNNHETS